MNRPIRSNNKLKNVVIVIAAIAHSNPTKINLPMLSIDILSANIAQLLINNADTAPCTSYNNNLPNACFSDVTSLVNIFLSGYIALNDTAPTNKLTLAI